MAIQINWNICDNADACSGIEVCPTGALFWNNKNKTIAINNDLCISCRLCCGPSGCPIGAIMVTDTEEDFIKAREIIDNDTRTKEQLFVERYGAPIDENICIDISEITAKVANGIVFIEKFFNDARIHCLLRSIKVDDIRYKLGLSSMLYYKCELAHDDGTTCYPRLEIYKNGKLLGVIEDYFEDTQIDIFIAKIEKILN